MLPHTEKSLVPVLFGLSGRAIFLYHSAPLFRMCGTAASVSTLLIVVGMPNTPDTAGNGGLMRGLPRFPSSEFISAVSSPQMYAPAPCARRRRRVLPVPIAFVPRMPGGVRFLERALHALERLGELAADVDVAVSAPIAYAPIAQPSIERVRRPAHDLAILERARLGLVGVAAEVVRLAVAGLHERPLEARRESGAAATAQPGLLHDRLTIVARAPCRAPSRARGSRRASSSRRA